MAVSINKVLISDSVNKKCEELLKAHGIDVVTKFNLSPTELIKELEVSMHELRINPFNLYSNNYNRFFQTCNGLIVRSETKVTKEIIVASKTLRVIGRAGTGVDNIDIDAATRKGIIVLK